MNVPENADVLICGAGPTGLMMAAQLLRQGVRPVIIDSRNGPSLHSKALAVQPRTLEIYNQLGIAAEAVAAGRKIQGARIHVDAEEYALELGNAGTAQTPYPFVLMYEQYKNERLLLNLLTKNACPVLWETELTGFESGADGYKAQVLYRQKEQVVNCKYLIGADGAHSCVRKHSGISFAGGTYTSRFFLADVVLEEPMENEHVHLFLQGKNFLGVFPMHDRNAFRLIGVLPENLRQKEHLDFAGVLPHISTTLPNLKVKSCDWFTRYNLHHRSVRTFSKGGIFLAGDAAHIHSPAGGQGMNTGLQDATNLAWKLAGVINGHYQARILSTYHTERLPVAQELVKTTDRVFSLMTSANRMVRGIRNLLLPLIVRYVATSGNMAGMFARIAQLAITYRHSPLSLHLSHKTAIRAGDRLPHLFAFNKKTSGKTALQDWNTGENFTLILLDRLNRIDMHTLRRWLSAHYPTLLQAYYVPYCEENETVFNAFEVIDADKKMILVRPDGYIGLLADGVDMLLLQRYFRQIIGYAG